MTDRLSAAELAVVERVCTPREFAVVQLAERGHGKRSIAKRLHISTSTVRDYLANASRKTRAALEGADHATDPR